MNRILSATLGLCVGLHLDTASSQEVKPGLDLQGYAEDMMRCGNEAVWDICKQCVNDAWNDAQVPWDEFCKYLPVAGVSAEAHAACSGLQSQSRRHKLNWCLTIEPNVSHAIPPRGRHALP